MLIILTCYFGKGIMRTYADAADRPRPREPPVTTATLPFREKREGKSWISASDMFMASKGNRFRIL